MTFRHRQRVPGIIQDALRTACKKLVGRLPESYLLRHPAGPGPCPGPEIDIIVSYP